MTAGEFVYLIRADKSQLNTTLNQSEKETKSWGNKLSAWTVAKGQMIANFATKAVTKVTDIASSLIVGAVNAAAEYEQLVGGVETLFKEAAPKVQKYASEAYKNVGISANEYMQNVTSFSASLLQSLGNDTDKAAEVADMAMIDMADNANKMGTAMDSIQHAYQGFAKQNYTMLDNLKLGYGGTKTEMERLLKDAGQIANKTFDIKKLSDVYEAIHVIQQEMGIAGTTQKEAMETVQGSLNAAKASWQDVLTAMGNGKGVKKAIKNFTESAKTALKNYAPVVRNAVEGLVAGAKELAPEIGNIINELGRGLFGKKWDITIDWIQNAWNDVQNAFNTAVEWVNNAYSVTVEWIQNAWQTVSNAFNDAKEWVNRTFDTVVNWVNTAWDDVNNAFTEAGKWIEKTFPTTVKWVRESWGLIKASFDVAKDWVNKTFETTVKWIQEAWDDVKNAIAEVGKKVWDNVVNFTLGLFQGVKDFIESLPKAIEIAVNFVKKVIDQTGENLKVAGENTFGDDMTAAEAMEYAKTGKLPQNTFVNEDSNAKGNWSVPYDDYKALLHRGERVLTASQARHMNDENMGYEQVAQMIGDKINSAFDKLGVFMYGDRVGDMTSKRVGKNIRTKDYSKLRAMGG